MKHFRCGDVVPGCGEAFTGTEGEILVQVGGPEVVDAVRTHMTSVA